MRDGAIRVGTRGSLLARTQTQWLLDQLLNKHPDTRFEVVVIRTKGDVHTHEAAARFMGKGFFTREIEEALLGNDVDLAVHSLKDLPTEQPAGLALAAIPPREDPRDALVGRTMADLAQASACVGTSSLRRRAQLLRQFPKCSVADLRGNVDTRLRKIHDGVVDCGVLAAAGLRRLGRDTEICELFPCDILLPAPGQGALAVQTRADDERVGAVVASAHCETAACCVRAERSFLHGLGGGCQLPVAALAEVGNGILHLRGRVFSLDGGDVFADQQDGDPARAEEIGAELATRLAGRGATELIRRIGVQLQQRGADG